MLVANPITYVLLYSNVYLQLETIKYVGLGFGLWCLTPLSTKSQLYRGGFIGGANQIPEENHRPVASH